MNRLRFCLQELLVLGFLLQSLPASGYEYFPSPCGKPYSWTYQEAFLFNDWGYYPVSSNRFQEIILQSMRTWGQVPVSRFSPSLSPKGPQFYPVTGLNDGRNEITYIGGFLPWPFEWDRIAQTNVYVRWDCFWSINEIYEADLFLNGRWFLWADGAISGRYDLQSIITHELGHAGGLDHTNWWHNTMLAGELGGDAPGETWERSLYWDDIAGMRYLYWDQYLYPSSYVYTENDRYRRGQTIYFDISTWLGYAGNRVDVYIGLTGPWGDGLVRYLLFEGGWAMNPVPYLSSWAVLYVEWYELFRHLFTNVDPTGDYTLYVAFYVPGATVKDIRNYEPNRYWRHSVPATLLP